MKSLLLSCFFLMLIAIVKSQSFVCTQKSDSLFFSYNGRQVFGAKLISSSSESFSAQKLSQRIGNKSFEMVAVHAADGKAFELQGIVRSIGQSMACESDAREGGLRVVRHSYGNAISTLDNAVYCRNEDWLLSFDLAFPNLSIAADAKTGYMVKSHGSEIIIRFRPHYYRDHRDLKYFDPSKYEVWKKPVVGWSSWFAYFDKVSEYDVHKTADALSTKLVPFGLEYLQVDDGYQQVPIGMPNSWLQSNSKFPSGLSKLAGYIQSKGMKPAIWTNVSFADASAAQQHAALFVKDPQNKPAKGNWVGYVMDGSNPATIQQLISPVYKGLRDSGWQYFKLDALRHLRYEGYNSFAGYFEKKKYDRAEAFRNVVKEVRKQVGKDHFLLACWGIRPELTGIADGCRIGNDGYSYAGLAQFNSYNNIVWRNDPDHIELSPREAYRSCVATSLTGSLFMVTDKAELYEQSPLVEAARRSIPVLFTLPGQVYDVDPSRSELIGQADIELSGSGPRPFDAGTATTTALFALDVAKPFENWLVLGRLNENDKHIPLRDLGLDPSKRYHVFEFWTKQYMGNVEKAFVPPVIDSVFGCQVFCFREVQSHPQTLATNRHISCGALELQQVNWQNNQLTGVSEVVQGDVYEIYIYEPEGFQLETVGCTGATIVKQDKKGMVRTITLQPAGKSTVEWTVKYK